MTGWRLGHTLKASLTRLRGSLRMRLLVRVLLFSSVVTLTLTATQLYLEYRQGVGRIDSRLSDIHDSYLGSLSEGLWRLDGEYLQIQLDGILRLSDIRAVEVRENSPGGSPLVVAAGERRSRAVVAREFPIFYRVQGRDQLIGSLYVEATLADLYRQLMNTALIILVSQGLKTFLVSLFIIHIVHRLITRHLAAYADYAQGYDLRRPPPPFRLQRPAQEPDELDQVVDAFNGMCASLQAAYSDLREREARIRRLVDANIIGIFFWNLSGAITEANDAFLALTGYSREDLLSGRVSWRDMTPPEYAGADARAGEELKTAGKCRPYEKEYVHRDGTRVPVLLAGALFEGSPDQGVAFVCDLSARKQAEAEQRAREAAEAASRAKSEFLANMSHELRSPLNTILGFTRLMSEDPALPEAVQEDLNLIMKSGEHLHELIDHVLDLSKLEAGRVGLEETDYDLDLLLDDLKDMFTPAAAGKDLQLIFEPRRGVPSWVRGDPLKLRQILINLIDNALKFTCQGEVRLRVAAHDRSGDACRLAFAVSDSGPGIPPEDLGRVLEAFVQAEAGRRSQEGTGLGLAISRSFVQLMGGELKVESEVGKGTTFRFDIPARVAPAAAPPGLPARCRPLGLAPGQPRYRMLVVDDHIEGRRLLVRLLRPLGFELREARNGQELVDIWREWRPEAIWTDLRMPVMDGRAAARQVRAEAGGRHPVIVAVTASAFEEERDDILKAGFDDFLRKPFRDADLFALIEKHLKVRFVYPEEKPAADRPPALDRKALAALPEALRAPLAQALVSLDTAAVDQAIADLRTWDAQLAAVLAAWARDFQYGRILSAIQGDRPGNGAGQAPS